MNTTKRIVFFTRYTADAPLSRYRSYAQKNNLEENGFGCRFYPFYSSASSMRWHSKGKHTGVLVSFSASLKHFLQLLFIDVNDIVVVEYPLLPGVSYRLQKWLLRKQKHIVTDLIYTSFEDKKRSDDWKTFLSASDVVVTPNYSITKRVLAIANEVTEIPPCVSIKEYTSVVPARIPEAEKNVFRIGWIGTEPTSHQLLMIKNCLLQLHDLYHIRFVLIGFDKKLEKELQDLPYIIHARDANTEISLLKTCHAGVLPLPDAATSIDIVAFPMIQYMACGLPVVASSHEVTIAVNHGNNNLFARTPFEWYSCLAAMIQDKAFYRETGEKNKTIANDFYSVEKTQKDYLSLFQSIIDN